MKKAIRFTAAWCGPCKMYAPMFENVAKENTEWEFETIDVDKEPDLAAKYGIRGIPTTVFEIEGSVAGKISGVLQPSMLKQHLEEFSLAK